MRIFVSGSLAYDRIMSFPGKFADHILPEKIHILNVCFLVNGLEERFGGTAGNIAYSLSLLGEKPTVLSCGGKDFAGYRERLVSLGLPMDGIRTVDDEFTAGAYITTDQSDNQITGFNPGAMKNPTAYDFSGVDPAHALAIVSPGNLQDMMDYPRLYRKLGIPFIVDPGQNITAFSGGQLAEMMDGSRALITNDYELEMVMKATGLDRAGLLGRTRALVTTLGEKGSVILEDGRTAEVPPAKVAQVADPTGAGDAFRSGLIKGLILGKTLPEAALLGSVAAAWCVEQLGTQEHAYDWTQFQERYRDNFGPLC